MDPLSIAAAAAGFLGLAGQVLDGLITIRLLYSTIKDAPEEVAALIAALEEQEGLFRAAASRLDDLETCGDIDTTALSLCLGRCQEVQHSLGLKLEKIGRQLRASRVSRLSIVFRIDKVRGMLADLERSKSSLVISLQLIGMEAARHTQRALVTVDTRNLVGQSALQEQL
ncbi:hypothetical protein LTR85_000351 [Meristemomyces frigidus]|nr:hypothetical protein LTR85_000351 [Meristemomyces frigidus]